MAGGLMTLEHLLKVMSDPSEPLERRTYCAIDAAPYCHVKLKAFEHIGQEGGPVEQKIVLTFECCVSRTNMRLTTTRRATRPQRVDIPAIRVALQSARQLSRDQETKSGLRKWGASSQSDPYVWTAVALALSIAMQRIDASLAEHC